MQLDKTQVVIRERSFLDTLDLSLHLIRRHVGPLFLAMAVGIVPLFALNAWLLSGLQSTDLEWEIPWGYLFLLVMLVIWEIPLATAAATLYLGQVVFQQRPSARRIAVDLFKSLPQLILYQVILRAILVWPVITWFWLFSQYNFLNEVILLERNPLRQRSPAKPSTERRCRTLHSRIGGELLVRWMGSVLFGTLLLLSFWGSLYEIQGLLLSNLIINQSMFTHYFHASLWLVVVCFTVARFLGYLDTRIRREGWEVELVMRAEGQRLAGPEA